MISFSYFNQFTHERLRQALALILFTQFVIGQQQQGEEEEIQRQQVSVFSRKTIYAAFSLQTGPRILLDFVEDLVAVKFAKFLLFLFVFCFFLVINHFNTYLVREILLRFNVPPNIRTAIGWIVYLGTFITGVWLSLTIVGVDFFGILITFGIIGFVVAPGVGTFVINAVSAIMIQITDKIELGYIISVGGQHGRVIDMTLSDVIIESTENPGEVTYMPNSLFFQTPMIRHVPRPVNLNDVTQSRLGPFVVQPPAQSAAKPKNT